MSQLPHFWCFFSAGRWEKYTENGAAVTSLRSFLFRDDFSLLLWRLSFDHPIEHSASKYLDGFDIGEWLSGLDNDSSRHGICFGLISLLELQGKVEFGLCSIWIV